MAADPRLPTDAGTGDRQAVLAGRNPAPAPLRHVPRRSRSTGGSGRTVADAMIHVPKVCDPTTTIAQAHVLFRNDHVHALLIIDGGRLLSVVERRDLDLRPSRLPAHLAGRIHGRVIAPDTDLSSAWRSMTNAQRRRLAVIDEHARLLGLLCLKRTGRGFCSDTDVRARAAERRTVRSTTE